jgi:hypothetical protein
MKIETKLQTLLCFGYQLKPVVKSLAIQKQAKSGKGGGHFFQNKSFVCVEIRFFRSKNEKFCSQKTLGSPFHNNTMQEK